MITAFLAEWKAAEEQAASLDGSGAAATTLYNRGVQRNKEGETEAALQLFLQALDISPQDPKVLLSAGNMQFKLGQLGAARELYTKVCQSAPHPRPRRPACHAV